MASIKIAKTINAYRAARSSFSPAAACFSERGAMFGVIGDNISPRKRFSNVVPRGSVKMGDGASPFLGYCGGNFNNIHT